MGIPHVHAVVIKAWADGAKIQENMYCGTTNPNKCWVDIGKNNQTILWCPKAEYRVKPEPKPDHIKYAHICLLNYGFTPTIISNSDHNWNNKPGTCYTNPVNIKLTFDGETNELKAVEMIKHE